MTDRGPRSRTLASFRTLTPEVIEHARRRAERPLSDADVRQAARCAGAPIAKSPVTAAAASLLAELAAGHRPPPAVARLLSEAVSSSDEGPSDSERAVAPWIAAGAEERGHALRDLLLLADRFPGPSRRGALVFPRIRSTPP
ncbi:MAG: hypothetical protein WD844_00705 [Thermoleophilaceae bacterium]